MYKPMLPFHIHEALAGDKCAKTTLKFPTYVQPKLNGMRCLLANEHFWSRNGKHINSVPHILNEVRKIFPPSQKLDGELYVHGWKLQKIMAVTRRTINIIQKSPITYMVFDVPGDDPFARRIEDVDDKLTEAQSNLVKLTPTILCHSKEHMEELYELFISEGYEGLMYRHPYTSYEYKRTKNLLRLKPIYEVDAVVTDLIEGKGKMCGMLGAFVVKSIEPTPRYFEVGSGQGLDFEYRSQIWRLKNEYIDKTMIVKYYERTANGIPFHGVFKQWRS